MTPKERATKAVREWEEDSSKASVCLQDYIEKEVVEVLAEDRKAAREYALGRWSGGGPHWTATDTWDAIERGEHVKPPTPRYELRMSNCVIVWIVWDTKTDQPVGVNRDPKVAEAMREKLEREEP